MYVYYVILTYILASTPEYQIGVSDGVSDLEYQMEYQIWSIRYSRVSNGVSDLEYQILQSIGVSDGVAIKQLYNVNNMLYMGRMLPISRVPDLPRRADP